MLRVNRNVQSRANKLSENLNWTLYRLSTPLSGSSESLSNHSGQFSERFRTVVAKTGSLEVFLSLCGPLRGLYPTPLHEPLEPSVNVRAVPLAESRQELSLSSGAAKDCDSSSKKPCTAAMTAATTSLLMASPPEAARVKEVCSRAS